MKAKVFWEIAPLKQYTVIFETQEVIFGTDKDNICRMFRKDVQTISYSEREALALRLAQVEQERDLGVK